MEKSLFSVRQLQPGIEAAMAALDEDRDCEFHDDGAAMTIEEATEFLLTGT